MASIIISIGPDNDFSIMDILDFELIAIASTDGIDQGSNFFVSQKNFLVLNIGCILRFATKRKNSLSFRVTSFLRRTACGITLNNKEFVLPVILA